MTSVIFLDIDGVVSPLPKQEPYRYEIDGPWREVQPMVPVRERLARWLANPPAMTVWASSWGASAVSLSRSIGAGPTTTAVQQGQGKPAAIAAWLTAHPEVSTAIICEDQPYQVTAPGVDVVVIHTDPHAGLTDADLSDIDAIIARTAQR